MKVLYVIRSVAHFSYHESIIRHLCARSNKVHVLFDRRTSRHYPYDPVRHFLAVESRATADWSIRRKDIWRRPLFASREVLSYSSYLTRKDQSDYYLKRWEGYLPLPVRLAVRCGRIKSFLASRKVQSCLRSFEDRVAPDATITRWLKEHKPDVVVASPINMRFSEEVEYIKAARSLGIPTAVPVLSWDNLTTKGVFHVIPDLTLAWNREQFESAMKIHRVPPDKIVVTGAPFFDKWFDSSVFAVERKAFCRQVGIHPDKPFVVYLGSSMNIARDETWLVRELAACLKRHSNPLIQRMNILVRPHPANAFIYEGLEGENIQVYPKNGALPDSESSMRDFYNTLRYCVATVGINTTGMIDAVIADKPCVAIMTDHYRSTQALTSHFRCLLDADVLEIAKSSSECVDTIKRLCGGGDSREHSRRKFVADFIRPCGIQRPAGAVAAEAIEFAGQGKSASQINAFLTNLN